MLWHHIRANCHNLLGFSWRMRRDWIRLSFPVVRDEGLDASYCVCNPFQRWQVATDLCHLKIALATPTDGTLYYIIGGTQILYTNIAYAGMTFLIVIGCVIQTSLFKGDSHAYLTFRVFIIFKLYYSLFGIWKFQYHLFMSTARRSLFKGYLAQYDKCLTVKYM